MRPIKPTPGARVRIEKWKTEWTRTHPWKVLTRYPGEPCWPLVGSFRSWDQAVRWACFR